MKKLFPILTILLAVSFILAACQPQTVVETVVVTQEVEKEVVVTQEVEKEVVVTEVVEVEAEPTDKTVIEFWTTDNEEERVDTYEAVAAAFMAENPDIDLRIVPIEEAGVSQRIATAQAANRLPDVVREEETP